MKNKFNNLFRKNKSINKGMNKKNKIKYILYARKSSESEDRQVASIDAQVSELKKIAKRENLNIVRILTESHSAKSPGRPIFNEMLKIINKGEADGILCWHLNRLARNPIDGGNISWMLQQSIIHHIQTHGRDYWPTDNILTMSVELGMANQYIRDLSSNVKRGLKRKAELGWYPTHAPVGYLNTPDREKGFKIIKKDPERFETVRRMFDLILQNKNSAAQVWRKICNDWKFKMSTGKPMARSTFYRILSDPFYYGEFEYPKESGNWYKGNHEAMITKREYDKIQIILGDKGKRRPANKEFAYTGLIRCGECGCAITAEEKVKKQKNGNIHRYIYYHCTRKKGDCSQRSWIRVEDLEEQISTILENIEIPPEFSAWALKWLKKKNKEEGKSQKKIIKEQQSRYEKCIRRINNLIDMRASESISDKQFKEKKKEAEKEKNKLKELLEDTDNRVNDWIEKAESALTFAKNARDTFNTEDLETKREILKSLGSNLQLKDKILSLSTKKTLLKIKEASKEVREIHGRLEPLETPENEAKLEDFYEKSPVVLRGQDSNL